MKKIGVFCKPKAPAGAATLNKVFKLGLGEKSLIKTGGYKVSALEIEDVLRTHDGIDECAVVGVEDEEWGQRVAAAVVQSDGHQLDLKSLRTWCKKRLATYKVPSMLMIMGDLPRNPMGKVTKPALKEML